MLPTYDNLSSPRRGAKLVKVTTVRRNVRLYSPDLVRSAASWATKSADLAASREWTRIAPKNQSSLTPRYSDTYRKRMDLPSSFYPYASSGTSSSASSSTTLVDEDEERFKTLADLKWGEFELLGFDSPATAKKALDFDLNESARKGYVDKRRTLTWADFSASGFTRSDAPLSATLQFSAPVAHSIQAWPAHSEEVHRKLKKTHKVCAMIL